MIRRSILGWREVGKGKKILRDGRGMWGRGLELRVFVIEWYSGGLNFRESKDYYVIVLKNVSNKLEKKNKNIWLCNLIIWEFTNYRISIWGVLLLF